MARGTIAPRVTSEDPRANGDGSRQSRRDAEGRAAGRRKYLWRAAVPGTRKRLERLPHTRIIRRRA